jgi:phage tail-like protein
MWIKKIEAPSFNATANEVAVESVELVHEGLSLEQ